MFRSEALWGPTTIRRRIGPERFSRAAYRKTRGVRKLRPSTDAHPLMSVATAAKL
jgi:hypothetical protein